MKHSAQTILCDASLSYEFLLNFIWLACKVN